MRRAGRASPTHHPPLVFSTADMEISPAFLHFARHRLARAITVGSVKEEDITRAKTLPAMAFCSAAIFPCPSQRGASDRVVANT